MLSKRIVSHGGSSCREIRPIYDHQIANSLWPVEVVLRFIQEHHSFPLKIKITHEILV